MEPSSPASSTVPPGMFCVWSESDDRWTCRRCGAAVLKSACPTRPFAGCRVGQLEMGLAPTAIAKATPRDIPKHGPGTELHRMLANWFGIVPSEQCPCRAMAAKMNMLGPDWCESEAGMAEILDVMRTEHARRKKAGETIYPWTEIGARQLIKRACRIARKNAAAATKTPAE